MCRAIFELLKTAPLDYRWLRTLYHVLSHLNYSQSAERIDRVLERWAQLPDRVREDRPIEGYYTRLCLRDEFRCFIGALFGKGYNTENLVVVLHGNQDASDVALRCAYYAQGDLTAEKMKGGYKKDRTVFTFAASLNPRVHRNGKLRKLMEDEYLGGDLSRLWLKYDEQMRKLWPSIPPVSDELDSEAAAKPRDPIRSSLLELQKGLATLTTRVSQLRQIMIVSAIILVFLIYFRAKY